MNIEAVDGPMLNLSKALGFLHGLSFYLAGGTGLALQIGHRKSYDMDFFTPGDFLPAELSSIIRSHHLTIEGEITGHGTLHCILEGVKTSFILYNEQLIFPLKDFHSIYVADWKDLTVEKLRTVADRGQKKDFFDLYFGVQRTGIEMLVELSHKKFGRRINYFHLLKGITYFEDADKNPDPILIDESVKWNEIKGFFLDNFKDFENAFGKTIPTSV